MHARRLLFSPIATAALALPLYKPAAAFQTTMRYCSSTSSSSSGSSQPSAGSSTPAGTPGKVKIRLTTVEGTRKEFSAPAGITLMEAIRDIAKVDMEAACDGTCACSTCHVIFAQESYDRLPDAPCEDEMDMLDLAPKVSSTSRLSCQVKLLESLDTIELVIPDEMENQMNY